MRNVDTIIFDFDNTLWDQVAAYEHSLRTLIQGIQDVTGAEFDSVLSGIVDIQTRLKLRENADLIQQHPALIAKFGDPLPESVTRPLFAAYAEAEQSRLNLFDGTRETLTNLKNQGFKLVLFSESNADRLARRVKALGMDHYFEQVYSAPPGDKFAALYGSDKAPALRNARMGTAVPHKYVTSVGPKKNGDCFKLIIADLGRRHDQVLMVGDNLARDVGMAQSIGVYGAYAKYGVAQKLPGNLYDQTGYGAFAKGEAKPKSNPITPDILLDATIRTLPMQLERLGAKPAITNGAKP